jgi:hypothetical protein
MRIIYLHFSIALMTLLSGCANLKTNIQPDNNFKLIEVNALTELPKYKADSPVKSSPDPVARLVWHRAQAINCSDTELAKTTPVFSNCSGLIRVYIEAAITASNQACNTWFDLLIHSDVETTYAKNMFNLVGNSAQALMGLTGDSPTQIAKVALALGVGNSSFDNYRAIYLMSPTLYKIRKKITDARMLATNSIRTNAAGYTSWDEDIHAYHKSCSREAIQEILNSGLEATQYKIEEANSDEVIIKEANQQLYRALFGINGEFSITELTLLADGQATIALPMPVAMNPLVKAAQAKFATLDQKGKSDFNRWLETSKRILDAKTKAAAAKETLAAAAKLREEKTKNPNTTTQSVPATQTSTAGGQTEYSSKVNQRIIFRASTEARPSSK